MSDPVEDETVALCEALVRHMEVNGWDCLEKNYIKNGKIKVIVWCMIGEDADNIAQIIRSALQKLGWKRDQE